MYCSSTRLVQQGDTELKFDSWTELGYIPDKNLGPSGTKVCIKFAERWKSAWGVCWLYIYKRPTYVDSQGQHGNTYVLFNFVLVSVCFEVMKVEDCKIAHVYMMIIVGGERKLRLSLGMTASTSGVAQVHPKLTLYQPTTHRCVMVSP